MDAWQNGNSGSVDGNLIQAGRIDQLLMQFGGHREPPVPDMLTLDPRHLGFTNRTAELHELDRLWREAEQAGAPLVVVLSGMPGIGKTLTALRWAHRMREEFPGGIFVGDLHGSDPAGARTPAEVLGTFLGRLGLSGPALPSTEEERGAAFREITAYRRILVVLDDAATAAQVRALLPSSPTSAVLVTSRRELTFLASGIRSLPLAPFEEDAAVELLTEALGNGAAAEQHALRKLSEACGRHPMALQVLATQLGDRTSISSYVDRVAPDLLRRLEVDGENPSPEPSRSATGRCRRTSSTPTGCWAATRARSSPWLRPRHCSTDGCTTQRTCCGLCAGRTSSSRRRRGGTACMRCCGSTRGRS
ncbi:NB-ARC domain-containing protein [Saccharopolyspora thermophila]|uniref:NB-ARC domain-containing protein n=1 Tax=Saccharopolyspora thermophila TaxID=89367 RepID=A0ABP3MM81_9PSEU